MSDSDEVYYTMNDGNGVSYTFPIKRTMLPFFMFPSAIPTMLLYVTALPIAALLVFVLIAPLMAPDADKWSPQAHQRAVQACLTRGNEILAEEGISNGGMSIVGSKKERSTKNMVRGTVAFQDRGLKDIFSSMQNHGHAGRMYDIFGFVKSVRVDGSDAPYIYACGADMQDAENGMDLNADMGNIVGRFYQTDVPLKEADQHIADYNDYIGDHAYDYIG